MKNLLPSLIVIVMAIIPFSWEWHLRGVWVTTSDLAMILVFLAWSAGTLVDRKRTRFPLLALTFALIACFAASAIHATDRFLVVKETLKFVILFGFFFACVNAFTIEWYQKCVFMIIAASAVVVSVWFLVDFHAGRVFPVERLWSREVFSRQHLNALGMFLIITIPMSIYSVLASKDNTIKRIMIVGIIIQIAALFLTYSRANWIALVITTAIYLLYKYKIKGVLYLTIFLALPFMIVGTVAPELHLKERLYSITDSRETSIVSRKEQMQAAVAMMRHEPVTGIGMGNFQEAGRKVLHVELTEMAHNLFLQYGAEAGVPALIFLVLIILKYYLDAIGIYKNLRAKPGLQNLVLFCLWSFTGIMISSQFGDAFIRGIKEYTVFLMAIPYAVNQNNMMRGDKPR